MGEWVFPVDPDCPEVKEFRKGISEDPYSSCCPSDVMAEIKRDWERKHLSKCKRCREFACANVSVE